MAQVILFLQQLINGLSLGSAYALVALGYTMVYGVLRFINFAHGDVYMLGAYAGLLVSPLVIKVFPLQDELNAHNFWAVLAATGIVILAAMVVCATLGVLIEKFAYRPLRS